MVRFALISSDLPAKTASRRPQTESRGVTYQIGRVKKTVPKPQSPLLVKVTPL